MYHHREGDKFYCQHERPRLLLDLLLREPYRRPQKTNARQRQLLQSEDPLRRSQYLTVCHSLYTILLLRCPKTPSDNYCYYRNL